MNRCGLFNSKHNGMASVEIAEEDFRYMELVINSC